MRLSGMKKKILLKSAKISILLVALNLIASLSGIAAPSAAFPEIGQYVGMGRGVYCALTDGGAICYDAEGIPLMCYSTQGGCFFAIELTTGKIRDEFESTGSYIMSHILKTAADGKVYSHIYPSGMFDVYDPIARTYTAVNPGYNVHSQDGGTVTDDGRILIGEYASAGASVYEYNIYDKTFNRYGPFDPTWTYIKGIAADGKYIYAGTGIDQPNCKVLRINRETGEYDILLEGAANIIYNMQFTAGKVIAHSSGSLHIIDAETFVREKVISGNAPSEPSPINENLIYTAIGSKLYEIDVVNLTSTLVGTSPLSGGTNFTQWAKLPDGQWVLGLRTGQMKQIGYLNPADKSFFCVNTERVADEGPNIQSLAVSPQDVVYMGGYQTGMSAYDIKTNEFIFQAPGWAQNEGVGFLDGKTYFGVYTGAEIWRYDPAKPWKFKSYSGGGTYQGAEYNPSMVYDVEYEQDRPFLVEGYNGKLYVGTFPEYAKRGGALVIYSEDEEGNPSATVRRNLIINQAITGLEVKDNLVYLSGSIRCGHGVDPIETQAKIAVYNAKTGVIKKRFVPNLPVVGTKAESIGDLSFGPDGLLWGCCDKEGLIFAMNPTTFEVEKYITVSPGSDIGEYARPLYLRWSRDGLLYANPGKVLCVIDPYTMEYERILNSCSLFDLDSEGNLWHASGAYFRKTEIDIYPRFEKLMESVNLTDYSSSVYLDGLKESYEKGLALNESSSYEELADVCYGISYNMSMLKDISGYVKELEAEISYPNQKISFSGVASVNGDVSVKIVSPSGEAVAYDQFAFDRGHAFSRSYIIPVIEDGVYEIVLNSDKFSESIVRTVSVKLADLKGFYTEGKISGGKTLLATAVNYGGKANKIRVSAVTYNKETGEMTGIKTESVSVLPRHFYYFSEKIKAAENEILKLFVWDGNEAPLIPSVIYIH